MDVNERIADLALDVEKMRLKVERIQSHIDSESGTLGRETTRLRTEIDKVERKFDDLFYDAKEGLVVRIDRLLQESEARKKTGQNIVALWIVMAGVLIKIVWDFFSK